MMMLMMTMIDHWVLMMMLMMTMIDHWVLMMMLMLAMTMMVVMLIASHGDCSGSVDRAHSMTVLLFLLFCF